MESYTIILNKVMVKYWKKRGYVHSVRIWKRGEVLNPKNIYFPQLYTHKIETLFWTHFWKEKFRRWGEDMADICFNPLFLRTSWDKSGRACLWRRGVSLRVRERDDSRVCSNTSLCLCSRAAQRRRSCGGGDVDGREGVLSGSVSMVKRRRNAAVICCCCLLLLFDSIHVDYV